MSVKKSCYPIKEELNTDDKNDDTLDFEQEDEINEDEKDHLK